MMTGLLLLSVILSALFFGEFRLKPFLELCSALSVFFVLLFGYFKYRFRNRESTVFFLNSAAILSYSCYNGILFLHETEIPRLTLYLKVYFIITLVFYLYLILKMKSEKLIFWATVILSVSIFNLNYFSLSFRTLPHLFYGIYALYFFRDRNRKEYRLSASAAVILFVLFSASLSAFLGADLVRSLFALSSIYCAGIGFYLASKASVYEKRMIQLLSVYQLVSATVIFGIFILIRHTLGTVPADDRFLAGFHVNGIGPYIAILFPSFALFSIRLKKYGWLALPIAMLSVYIIIYGHNRSALFAVLISAVIFLFILVSDRSAKKQRLLLMLGMSSLISAFILFLLVEKYSIINMDTLWIRMDIWKIFIAKTLHYAPWTGFGHESFHAVTFLNGDFIKNPDHSVQARIIHDVGADTHPHNYFLVFLYSGGFLGLSAFLAVCAAILAETLKRWKKRFGFYGASEASVFSGMLLFGLLDSNLAEPEIQILLMTFFGMYCRKIKSYSLKLNLAYLKKAAVSGFILLFLLYFWIFYNFAVFYGKIKLLKPYLDFSRYDYLMIRPEAPEEILKQSESLIKYEIYPISTLNYSLNSEILILLSSGLKDKSRTEAALTQLKKCVRHLQISPYCSRRISEIEEKSGNASEAEYWRNDYRKKDPYHFYKD